MANFYIMMLLFYIMWKIALGKMFRTQSSSQEIDNFGKVQGLGFQIWSVAVGIIAFIAIRAISTLKGQILGVAPLAVESSATLVDKMALWFAPLMSGTIGFIENYFFMLLFFAFVSPPGKIIFQGLSTLIIMPFTLLAGLFKVPIAGEPMQILRQGLVILLPAFTVCLIFGGYHVIAYNFDLGKMLWAGSAFAIFIITYYLTNKDLTAMNVTHFSNNASATFGQTLSIIG
jgi:hypothetical protein